MWGPPKNNLFIKNCVFILTCWNFSHLQSTLHLMQYTYQDIFSTAQNSFRTLHFWCLLVLLQFFCFTSSTLAKCFPLRTFFIWGSQKESLSERDWVNREGGAQGSWCFWSKTADTQRGVGRCTCKSPIMKWADALKVLKKPTEAECRLSQGQLVRWYRWIPRTLT